VLRPVLAPPHLADLEEVPHQPDPIGLALTVERGGDERQLGRTRRFGVGWVSRDERGDRHDDNQAHEGRSHAHSLGSTSHEDTNE
jgi:hypothetical protein